MSAIGLVETKGLLAAIEGADAMLKAADVRLLEKNLAGGGLVTITIAGEVSAVAAAVSAAVAAIGRIPGSVLVSQHVIPRPDAELSGIILTEPKNGGHTPKAVAPKPAAPAPKAEAPAVKAEPVKAEAPAAKPEQAKAKPQAEAPKAAPAQPKAQAKKSGKKSSKKK